MTPSTTVDMLGSTPVENTSVPTPRMRIDELRVSLPTVKVTLGTSEGRLTLFTALLRESRKVDPASLPPHCNEIEWLVG